MDELPFDPDFANELIGKHLLVGFNIHNQEGELVDRFQLHGWIESCDEHDGTNLRLPNAEHYRLPPLDPMSCQPGDSESEYRIQTTGEVVTGVDFTTVWNVTKPADA